jgi:hypothetical protein
MHAGRDRRCGRVSVALDVVVHLLGSSPEPTDARMLHTRVPRSSVDASAWGLCSHTGCQRPPVPSRASSLRSVPARPLTAGVPPAAGQ